MAAKSLLVPLLKFVRSEQWTNAIVRYCELEHVCSRATAFKMLENLEEEGLVKRRQGIRKEGSQKVFYGITPEGEKRIQIESDLELGKVPPSKLRLWEAETRIISVPGSLPPALRSRLKRILADENLTRELGTLLGSATLAYSMSFEGRTSLKSLAESTGAGYSGGFTD